MALYSPHWRSLWFPLTPSSLCLCMLLTCSCCRACSELFVQVSAVKATLVGPLSWSLWLSGSPLREPRGGCHYTHCQWGRHNGLALSIVWSQAWGWHQHLIHSSPVSLPLPLSCTQTDPLQCNTGVSPNLALENCNRSTLPADVIQFSATKHWVHCTFSVRVPHNPVYLNTRQVQQDTLTWLTQATCAESEVLITAKTQIYSAGSESLGYCRSDQIRNQFNIKLWSVQSGLFAPSPWLRWSVIHKQNEPHLSLSVLRARSVPERATSASRLQAPRSRVRRGRGTMAGLKIEPSLLCSTSLFKLRRQLTRAARHTGKLDKHSDTPRQTRLTEGLAQRWTVTHQQIPMIRCLGRIQQFLRQVQHLLKCKWNISYISCLKG